MLSLRQIVIIKGIRLLIILLVPFYCIGQSDMKLFYEHPAQTWTEALPVENGRLGAMIFGRESEELIQLNESTLWSGGPVSDRVDVRYTTKGNNLLHL
jgi:alpha-L-fucosidase 2